MTGIDRLRTLAGAWGEWGLGGELFDVADQIERELSEERDPADDVSMSAYDLLPEKDREAIAWVREHGGLGAVKAHWEGYVPASWLEKAKRRYERKRDNLKAHAWELERKCAERRERIKELERNLAKSASDQLKADSALYDLSREVRDVCKAHGIKPGEDPLGALDDALDSRLMPEGMEWLVEAWPRFEDDAPVRIGDEVTVIVHDEDGDFDRTLEIRSIKYKQDGVLLEGTKNEMVMISHGERVKRPAPKVLDADGEEIRVGDHVWNEVGTAFTAIAVDGKNKSFKAMRHFDGQECEGLNPAIFTHRAPVLAADEKPLREGETVWDVLGNRRFKVLGFGSDAKLGEFTVKTVGIDSMALEGWSKPNDLTHERPVMDTWERLEEDADRGPHCGMDFEEFAHDLVRRAKALAERGQ